MDLHGATLPVLIFLPTSPGLSGVARGRAMVAIVLDRPGHRNLPRTHDLPDAQRPHQLDEGLDLVGVAGQLDGHRTRADIHHVRAESGYNRIELAARALLDRDLDHHHLAV